jgi:hypothetical protein
VKIALLVPSRERIEGKIALVKSIAKTADINNVSLYFGIDDDDPNKNDALKIAQEYSFVRIVEIHNEGKFLGLGRLWNICLKASNEEIIAMIGDDMEFRTEGWDTKVIDEFKPPQCPQDDVKMVYCYDGRHGHRLAVNAFINRRYTEITGYFMREEFKVDFIDLWLQQIFSSLGRLKYRGDIHIEHKHWSFKKMSMDRVATNLRGNNYPEMSKKMWKSTFDERIKEAKKIGQVIGVDPDLSRIREAI